MANAMLDILFPDIMDRIQKQKDREKKEALTLLDVLRSQPDLFPGVSQQRLPSVEEILAYQKGTGASWPTREVQPGREMLLGDLSEGAQVMTGNVPTEVMAFMPRSPIKQMAFEGEETAEAQANAELARRERMLEGGIGDILRREATAEAQAGTAGEKTRLTGLEDILTPHGWTIEDVIEKKYGLPYETGRTRTMGEKEQDYAFGLEHPTTPFGFAMKESGKKPGLEVIGDIARAEAEGRQETGTEATREAQLKEIKMAQDLFAKLIGKSDPGLAGIIAAANPKMLTNPVMAGLIEKKKLEPETQELYDHLLKLLKLFYGVPEKAAAPAAQPAVSKDEFLKKWGLMSQAPRANATHWTD